MDFRSRRETIGMAGMAVARDPRTKELRRSSGLFSERFAEMQQEQREAWVDIQTTAQTISSSGDPNQRKRMRSFKAEIEQFLTEAFTAANLQECDIATQNNQLTQILLREYKLMDVFVARLEVQKFCHAKLTHS